MTKKELEDRIAELEYELDSVTPYYKDGEKWWSCLIGPVDDAALPPMSDVPMRQSAKRAFLDLAGEHCEACFSGWGAAPNRAERDVLEGL